MPPVVRFIQTEDLDAWQRVLLTLCLRPRARMDVGAPVVVVPDRAAAEQWRRTVELRLLVEQWHAPVAIQQALEHHVGETGTQALLLPRAVTRDQLYDTWHREARLDAPRLPLLTREVVMSASGRDAACSQPPPFAVRPGIVAEMLRFHDQIDRLGGESARWLSGAIALLAGEAATDRGAARLLAQSRFLQAAFTAFRERMSSLDGLDEPRLRAALQRLDRPWSPAHIVVTVADHHADPAGLWPVDIAMLSDARGLARIDVVATRRQVAAGLFTRLRRAWPDAVDVRVDRQRPSETALEVTSTERRWIACRDRDEEVLAYARRMKVLRPADAATCAFVYRRPLPYLYAARHLFGSAGLPYQSSETLPLAAEPWAAALDLLMDVVLAGYTRAALVALLRSPHVAVPMPDGRAMEAADVAAFDRALARDRFFGSLDRFDELVVAWRAGQSAADRRDLATARAVADGVRPLLARLAALHHAAPGAHHLRSLRDAWTSCARPPQPGAAEASRTRRTRASVDDVLERLQGSLSEHDHAPVPARETFTVVRRWIEDRTLALDRGGDGVHLVDVEAARYGVFEHMRLAGLLEGEWPEPTARDIFYPAFMLERLGWPDERARASALRARFADLLTLPTRTCGVSVPELDQDAVVRPSSLLDELQVFGSDRLIALASDDLGVLVTREDALLATAPVTRAEVFDAESRRWAEWRVLRPPRQGVGQTAPAAGERYSVTAVERYLQCPFQYFASRVLALREDAEDEAGLPARDAGLFVHDVLHACFARWHALGFTVVRPDDLPHARRVFGEIAEQALATVPPGDRPLERVRLFGSSVASGLLEKVLRTEAEVFGDVVRRALEHDVDQVVHLPAGEGTRAVHLRGRVDRVDWTGSGAVRVIDYKTGRKPQHALQPGVYAHAVVEQERDRGRTATIAPSGFIALREDVPWIEAVGSVEDADAQARMFVDAVEQIEAGAFPVRPANPFRCQFCEYPGVCRKDYVGDE